MFVSVLILSMGIAFATSSPADIDVPMNDDITSITGAVTDAETSAPIPNAEITLNESGETAQSDEAGMFTFSDLEIGSYTISVNAEGYAMFEGTVDVTEDGANINVELNAES